MDTPELNSVDAIRKELNKGTKPSHVMIMAEDFIHHATEESSDDVKQLLMEIATDWNSTGHSLSWLTEYDDPELIPFFLTFLDDEKHRLNAIYAFHELVTKNRLEFQSPQVIDSLLELLPQDNVDVLGSIINLFSSLNAVKTIDVIDIYLEHPHRDIRLKTAATLIELSKLTDREDTLEKTARLLEDPDNRVNATVAVALKKHFPEQYPDLDPKEYLLRALK